MDKYEHELWKWNGGSLFIKTRARNNTPIKDKWNWYLFIILGPPIQNRHITLWRAALEIDDGEEVYGMLMKA
jgi:hypothetical protein